MIYLNILIASKFRNTIKQSLKIVPLNQHCLSEFQSGRNWQQLADHQKLSLMEPGPNS